MTGVDVLLLDVSRDPFHLGPANAARLADALGSPRVIPHHDGCYDAPDFAAVNGDPAEVAALLRDGAARLDILATGERFDLRGDWWYSIADRSSNPSRRFAPFPGTSEPVPGCPAAWRGARER
jgi:hypothetical protein